MSNAIERAITLNNLIADVQALNVLKHEGTHEEYLEACCDALSALTKHAMGDVPTDADCGVNCQDWYYKMCLMFQEAGITVLGSGHFSMAVRFDGLAGKVIKIGFKKEDSGAAYAAYCKDRIAIGEQLIGVKFDSVAEVEFMKRFDKFYMVVMPEYQTFEDLTHDANIHNDDKAFIRLQFEIANGLIDNAWLHGEKTIEQFAMRTLHSCESYDEVGSLRRVLETRKDVLEGFVAQCKNIREFFKDIASFDTHDENVMVKWVAGQAQLVITDPVSWVRGE